MIVQKQGGNILELSFLYSAEPKASLYILQTAAMILEDDPGRYGDAVLVLDAPFPESAVMVKRFFDNPAVSHIYEAELLYAKILILFSLLAALRGETVTLPPRSTQIG